MQQYRRSYSIVLCAVLALAGCGHETKVTRVDAGVVTDLSGRWNDTDSRMVAEAMVKEALQYPWLGNFTQTNRRQPVVVVGTVLNSSH
ncbi:MAG: penicillin-binding protein activator LpoB, partial [Nitrospira sp.]|nr:penicillin-binding protein activator LpoB [Nitrospira sp.]